MAWNPSIFWSAFANAGMLVDAVCQSGNVGTVSVKVGFSQPDQVVLDGMVHSTDYSIEYQRADVALRRGDTVTINSTAYTVRQTPQQKGDGFFMTALLEKVTP